MDQFMQVYFFVCAYIASSLLVPINVIFKEKR